MVPPEVHVVFVQSISKHIDGQSDFQVQSVGIEVKGNRQPLMEKLCGQHRDTMESMAVSARTHMAGRKKSESERASKTDLDEENHERPVREVQPGPLPLTTEDLLFFHHTFDFGKDLAFLMREVPLYLQFKEVRGSVCVYVLVCVSVCVCVLCEETTESSCNA